MKCLNCGVDAGRKGNRHVKSRKFTCKRTSRELRTKRNWLGRREEYYVDANLDSLFVPSSLTDWVSSDEDYYSRNYSDPFSSERSSYSYDPPVSSYQPQSDDSWGGRSSSSDSSWGSDSGSSSSSSWSSSDSGGSSSSWSSSSSDSGSSSSSSDSGSW